VNQRNAAEVAASVPAVTGVYCNGARDSLEWEQLEHEGGREAGHSG